MTLSALKAFLWRFILIARDRDMPVGYLRRVVKDYDFTFKTGRGNEHTETILNNVVLYEPAWTGLIPNAQRQADATSVDKMYHESTHAYVDLEDVDETDMWREAVSQYKGVKLDNGNTVSDADEVVQEAAATYVGHRASHTWIAQDKITFLSDVLDKFEAKQIREDAMKQAVENVLVQGTIPGTYNRAMLERVFGYETVSGNQVDVSSEPIPDRLRQYCDSVILENKIWDNFNFMPRLAQPYERLRQRLAVHYRGSLKAAF